jgi:hypothetical protein
MSFSDVIIKYGSYIEFNLSNQDWNYLIVMLYVRLLSSYRDQKNQP